MQRVACLCVLFISSVLTVACGNGSHGGLNGGGGGQTNHHDVLYVPSNSSGGEILVYVFDSTKGTLGGLNGSFTGPPVAVDIKVDTVGKFLYASDFAANAIYGYSIDASSGNLTPADGSPFPFPANSSTNGGPLAVDPAGKFVFSSNAAGSIVSFAINSTSGTLSLSSGPMLNNGLSPFYLLVAPSGKFLYASNHGDGAGREIYAFGISNGGVLSQAPGSPFTFEINSQPAELAMNTADTVLYAALSNAGLVAGLSVDPTSSLLLPLPGSPYPAKFMPMSVVLAGNG